MADLRYGYNPGKSPKGTRSKTTNTTSEILLSARVRDIILDNTHPLFQFYGEWNSIGTIFFEPVRSPYFSDSIPTLPAYPLFPNLKQYPLINEVVSIVYLADSDVTEKTTTVAAYYFPPTNIWNSQTHNAIPSTNVLPPSMQRDYAQVEAGSVRRVPDSDTSINLGRTFNENNVINTHPLLPYEGDIIYEGRYGNSIRLGSTVNNAVNPNNWSTEGENGSPITIIRNGQPDDPVAVNTTSDPWVPIIEDINQDKSSIYLTSTQQIDIGLANNNQASFNTSDDPPSYFYTDSQIILNSGRLVFNASKDSIILSSQKHIKLSSNEGVHIDANLVSIASDEIYLGSRQATERLILGDTFISDYNTLLDKLISLANQLLGVATVAPGVLLPISDLIEYCNVLKTKTEDYLSDNVKTN